MSQPVHGDVFDHHTVVYEWPNGIRVYALCRTTTGCYDEDSSLVFGTKGKASIKACRIWGETSWRWHGQCDPYQVEHDRLFAAIRSGKPLNSGHYMARSTLITVMGQLSCYTGREVTWDEVNHSNFHYPPRPEECRQQHGTAGDTARRWNLRGAGTRIHHLRPAPGGHHRRARPAPADLRTLSAQTEPG